MGLSRGVGRGLSAVTVLLRGVKAAEGRSVDVGRIVTLDSEASRFARSWELARVGHVLHNASLTARHELGACRFALLAFWGDGRTLAQTGPKARQ